MKQKLPPMRGCPILHLKVLLATAIIFLTFGSNILTAGVLSSSKQISISIKKSSLNDVLDQIKNQSGVKILYNTDLLKNIECESITFKDAPLKEVLQTILKGTGFGYQEVNGVIVIKEQPQSRQPQKTKDIKGKVLDNNGDPLPGVAIQIKGTKKGALTDINGNFNLEWQENQNATLIVSFMGFKTTQVKYEGRELAITLEQDHMSIEDVVITGQVNISKNSFTGNATTIRGNDILKVSRTNVIKALQSFDPSFRLGDNIQFGSDPNAIPEVFIRGRSSLGTMGLDKDKLSKSNLEKNPNTPTFIMDGFEVSIQKVYDLDPNRIQTMTILKDAAATAMYGSRAANGVVVITTVPPKEGEVRVSYNLTTTLEIPDLSDYSLMNSREKLEAERLAGLFGADSYGGYEDYIKKYNTIYVEGVETDWMALPLRNAIKHKHSASVEGGTKSIRYLFDASYDGDNGVMKGSNRNTGAVGFNINMNFGKMSIKNYVSYNNTTSEESPYGSFSDYSHCQPYAKYINEKGVYPQYLNYGYQIPNPMYETSLNNFTKNKMSEIMDNLKVRWDFSDFLFAEGQLGVLQKWDDNNDFVDPLSSRSTKKLDTDQLLAGDLYTSVGNGGRINGKLLLSFNRTVDKHNMNFSLNAEMTQSTSNNVRTHYRGFPSGTLNSVNYASEVDGKPIKLESKSRTAGVNGIFNYSFDNIYLADVSLRYEGSSAFGTKEKAAPYWAAGLGVNIHNYDFMKNSKLINTLRVRGSYGQVGNVNFPAYAAQSYYDAMFDDWYITGYGTKIKYLGNKNLKGEKTNTFDVGFNLTMFDNRLDMKTSYYNKTTVDMINDVTIPSSSGFTVYKDNLGKVRNVGFEAYISGTVVQTKDWNLSLNVNFAQNKNKMIEISESLKNYNNRVNDYYGSETDYGENDNDKSAIWTKYEEGRSMTALYGMKSLGIDPATGKEVFVNRNGGIVYDWNAKDMVDIGDTAPKGQGSFGLNGRYKNFTLTASLQYEFGGYYYNSTLISYVENADIENYNVDKRVLTQRWQKPGDISPLKDIKDKTLTTRPSSRFIQKNNFVSLNSVSLQYEFGELVTKTLHIERLRLEANCSELFRLSTIKQERGLSYPFARSYGLTLMANF